MNVCVCARERMCVVAVRARRALFKRRDDNDREVRSLV